MMVIVLYDTRAQRIDAHCSIFRNYSSRGFYNEEIYSIQPIYETQYLCWKDRAILMFEAQTMDYQLEAIEQCAD